MPNIKCLQVTASSCVSRRFSRLPQHHRKFCEAIRSRSLLVARSQTLRRLEAPPSSFVASVFPVRNGEHGARERVSRCCGCPQQRTTRDQRLWGHKKGDFEGLEAQSARAIRGKNLSHQKSSMSTLLSGSTNAITSWSKNCEKRRLRDSIWRSSKLSTYTLGKLAPDRYARPCVSPQDRRRAPSRRRVHGLGGQRPCPFAVLRQAGRVRNGVWIALLRSP